MVAYPSGMPAITLKAHFDGQRILLDEPFDLPKGSRLMVTVLPPPPPDGMENAQWSQLSSAGLARAYGDDEPEYSMDDVKP